MFPDQVDGTNRPLECCVQMALYAHATLARFGRDQFGLAQLGFF
jgi:hypothetical protein